jgi:hypothetical protein
MNWKFSEGRDMRKTTQSDRKSSPDNVCLQFSRRNTGLVVKKLDRDTVLVEWTKAGLEFLGNLLLAQSRFSDCGFQLGPKQAGKIFFKKSSKFGLYIHRFCGKSA